MALQTLAGLISVEHKQLATQSLINELPSSFYSSSSFLCLLLPKFCWSSLARYYKGIPSPMSRRRKMFSPVYVLAQPTIHSSTSSRSYALLFPFAPELIQVYSLNGLCASH